MTVSAETVVAGPFAANGVTTAFPFGFEGLAEDEVIVLVDEEEISSSLYSVALSSGGGGTVTFTTAPADGTEVLIISAPAFEQDLALTNNGPFLADSIEDAFDRGTARDVWLKAMIEAVSPEGSLVPGAGAGKFVGRDADGRATFLSGTGNDPDLRTDLAEETGAALVGWKAPGAGAIAQSIESSVLLNVISVMYYIPTALHDTIRDGSNTTDLAGYVQACVDAAGDNIAIDFPAGTYLLKSTIRIGEQRVHLRFAGKWATIFKFQPTANDVMFHFEAADDTSVLYQCSVTGGCAITSSDTSYQKIGFYIADVSSFLIEGIHYLAWHTAATYNSEVIRLAGREKIKVDDIHGGGDIAVRVRKNAHTYVAAAGTIDIDHSVIKDIYSTCTSTVDSLTKDSGGGSRGIRPNIWIDDGVNLTTTSIRDCALVAGTDGIVFWDETTSQAGSNLDIYKVRFEQGTAALGHAIIVHHNYSLSNLDVRNSEFGTGRGAYLAKVNRARFRACNYPGSTVSINATATDVSYMLAIEGGAIAPSTLSLTGYYLCSAPGAAQSSRMGDRLYVYDAGGGTADHAENAVVMGPVRTMRVRQSIANGGSWSLNCGTNAGVVIADVRVNWKGATKRGIGLAQISAAGVLNNSGSHADFDVANTGGKFCLVASNAPAFVNNLGETVTVMAVIDFVV